MAMIYYKVFKVPVWCVIEGSQNKSAIIRFMEDAGALHQPWPSTTFKSTVESFKNRGWGDYIKFGEILPPQLVEIAAVEHLKKTISPLSKPFFSVPVHRIDRLINSDKDYARIMDILLESMDPLTLSQVFQVAERCHDESVPRSFVWYSESPVNKKVLTAIAQNVMTIGVGDHCDVNLSNVKKGDIGDILADNILPKLPNK